MPISFGKSKEEDVVSLIAAKKYARAVEVLKAQLQKRGANPSLRMQLADVLIMADKKPEAVALLLPLADQYARDGFAAKAVSVLKKVQKIDPGRKDVEERLARQIEERQREAAVSRPRSVGMIGMEEAGAPAPDPDAEPSLEIGFESMAPVSAPVETPPPVERAPLPPRLAPIALPPPVEDPAPVAVPALAPAPEPPSPPALVAPMPDEGIEDYDLLYAGEEEDEEVEVTLDAVEVIEAAPAAEPMSAGQFADELMGLVDSVFQEFPDAAPAAASAPENPARGGSQIVVSPLFRDFSVDEMVAVIQGLKLLTFERGQTILREGQPGGSLYTLTSGRVRVFRKDVVTSRQNQVVDLKEGAFFGEISILTGQPRMASIVALTRCELLELDRPTLDEIAKTHPHVWDVLREFAGKRAAQPSH
ncbi:MAG TPA: cyclic nucleotide-binding domain-containing protein [Vicinamibacteria bacterium]|nr:cyclic nucleotide-binding domain-containing protein [Vicinamibacteria bacterium]